MIHTAFIGDVILTGLLVEGLYQAGHQIIFFTKSKTREIFENDLRVSKIVVVHKPKGIQKLFGLFRIVQQIKNEELDALLCPHRSLTTTLCAYFSGVKLTVGFKNANFSFLYKIRKPYIKESHECLRYLDLLDDAFMPKELFHNLLKIGRPLLNYSKGILDPAVKPRDDTPPRGPCARGEVTGRMPYFIVAVGSAWNTKKYELKYFSQICEYILSKNQNLLCYLTGDKNDEPDVQKLKKDLLLFGTRVVNKTSQSTLGDLIGLIAHAAFVISNDSAPVHLASAFNIPIICFFGPTIPEYGFGPLSAQSLIISHKTIFKNHLYCQPCSPHGSKLCPEKHHLCMKKLAPNLILPKITQFLGRIIDF